MLTKMGLHIAVDQSMILCMVDEVLIPTLMVEESIVIKS